MFLILIAVIPLVTGMSSGDPCTPNPCGQNTQCQPANNHRAVCNCLPGYFGDPLTYCQRGECQDDYGCLNTQTCSNYRCINVCTGKCGLNADCNVKNRVPICSCPPSYTGDPFRSCRRFDPEELCRPSPCGINTKCEVINGIPTCSCLPGFTGSPLSGCKHECESDYECDSTQACQNFKCRNACQTGVCAATSLCEVHNHRPVCTCPKGFFGDPLVSCRAECEIHSDCPRDRPSCIGGQCTNPCNGVCGVNANCEVRSGVTPVCSCPKDMTGNPFIRCRPFEPEEICIPNPCGTNAKCQPGYDNTGKDRPVCTCYAGYVGNPLTICRKGECSADNECRDDQICVNYECKSVCTDQCGINAQCNAKFHTAICSCPAGYTGSALSQCYPQSTSGRSARYYSKRKRDI